MMDVKLKFPSFHFPAMRKDARAFLGIYLLLTCLFAGGTLTFNAFQKNNLTNEKLNELNSVVGLKSIQLGNWLEDIRNDARAIGENPFVSAAAKEWISGGHPDNSERQKLEKWLSDLRKNYEYHEIILLTPELVPLLSSKTVSSAPLQAEELALAEKTLNTSEILVSDIFPCHGNIACMSLAAPLTLQDNTGKTETTGILLAKINPDSFLFPLTQTWPSPSESAETLIVRKEGRQVTYLNDLRFRPGKLLADRMAEDKLTLPSALIFNRNHDFFESVDYRGVPVLAVMREIPGMPWIMISKIDIEEFLAPQRHLALISTLMALGLILASGYAIWIWWLRQRTRFEALEIRKELENEKLRNKYEILSRNANDIILVSAGNGRILDANERAIEAYGYRSDVLLSMPIQALVEDKQKPSFQRYFSNVRKAGFLVFESLNKTADGTTFPVEINARTIVMDGETVFLSVIRNIAERKQALEALKSYAAEIATQNRKMDAIFASTPEHVWLFDRNLCCIFASKAALTIISATQTDVMGRTLRMINYPTDALLRLEADLAKALGNGETIKGRTPLTTPSGLRHFEYIIFPVHGEGGSITGAGATLHDITERKQAEERIQYLAHYDILTGLPNRVMLDDYISAAIASAQQQDMQTAVLLLDLDRFKTINDSLGHVLGDTLLQAVAERIKKIVHSKDIVGRMGGDEFIILSPGLRDADEAARLGQKIIESMADPFVLGDNRITTSPSIGISIYPFDGIDSETLIRNADTAMYQAKASGRNNFQFFAQQMTARAQELMSLDIGLRKAFENNEFLLHYQPQVRSSDGAIIGAEALVRWLSPEKGMIPPGKFIPVTEETGLIIPLGEWILRTAFETAAKWHKMDIPPVTMAINLSAIQFRSPSLLETIERLLKETGVPPELIELELTEGIIMSDAKEAIEKLQHFKDLGLKLSIDDFGTGYSSLSYLRRFPIDKLKIDQSFVRDLLTDPGDAAITNSIIALARELGLHAIAEGVETKEQFEYLRDHNCEEIQGYYFSRPIPEDEFTEKLKNQ